ncbi:M28 family peptidase [candidate division KSB1 bacterium]|nr:M28 family peptidase [candidate division KSB1 bacterium]
MWRRLQNKLETKDLKQKLAAHVQYLSASIGERNISHYENLENAYRYIKTTLESFQIRVNSQNYQYQNKEVHNVIAEIQGTADKDEVLIVGAHYDSVSGSPGADDNASGIAGLLELARLYRSIAPRHTIRFIAFTLEEPPVFGSSYMGSQYYASKLHANHDTVIGMICLEMIGYYTSKKGSQQHHPALASQHQPGTGNFIAIVGDLNSKSLVYQVDEGIKMHSDIPTFAIASHRWIPGVDLSDHASFWHYNYPAIMLTDTAYYRNPNYHSEDDTYDTLNYQVFSKLITGLFKAIQHVDQNRTSND